MSEEEKWLVVYVASRQEKISHKVLHDRGIEVYLPLVRRLRQWSDRKKWVDFPLFPGYVFVRPDGAQREEVLEVPGVVRYLRFNNSDALVNEREIRSIRNIEKSGYSVEAISSLEEFEIGDRLEITEGPLIGQEVQLLLKKNRKEVVVLLDGMRQAVKIDLPGSILRVVK